MRCSHCQSNNTYEIGNDWIGCRTCGRQRPIKGDDMAKRGTCTNCGRPDQSIATADGICQGCYYSVKGFEKGSAEYIAALAAAKEKFSQKASNHVKKHDYAVRENPIKKTKSVGKKSLPTQPKKQKDGTLVMLEDLLHELMEQVNEITVCIQIIKKYQKAA